MQFLLLVILLIIVVALIFLFTSRRRRAPIVVHVADEKFSDRYRKIAGNEIHSGESSNIQSLIERIKEIDEKINIILEKDISDEAKKIVIHELEEEKKKLEEEVKKSRI